jgi:hypothetical protein
MIARIACGDDRLPIQTKSVGLKLIDLDQVETFDVLAASETDGRIGLTAGAAKIGTGNADISVRDAPTRPPRDIDAHFELVLARFDAGPRFAVGLDLENGRTRTKCTVARADLECLHEIGTCRFAQRKT